MNVRARLSATSWDIDLVEYLRQHERVSVADRDILNRAKQFLAEGETTKSSHWLGDRES